MKNAQTSVPSASEASVSRSIDIDERIDASPIGLLQWRIVAICFALAAVDGFDAQAIAFVAPLLKAQFTIASGEMGFLFSSALVGLMIGAFVFSPVADRIGRKPVIIVSGVLIGVFALLTATASSVTELFAYRFLTGIGIGGVMPNINTLTSEFAPARQRAFLMTLMFAGFPLGAVAGGLVSTQLIASYGWPSVFVLGGVAPIVLIPAIVFYLPESLRFQVATGASCGNVARTLSRVDTSYSHQASDFFTVAQKGGGGSVLGLFREGRASGTLLIWITVFANLLIMYSLMSWLPSVMREANLPLSRAILAAVVFNFGGVVGGLVLARIIDRHGPYGALAIAFAFAAAAIAAIGVSTANSSLAFAAIFVGGFTVIGTQFGMNALTVNFYPTGIRATGLGWAHAMGRIGSIIGPIAVGAVLALEWELPQVFLLAAAPAFICFGAINLLGRQMARA